jgi:hypothetical protein
MNWVIAAMTHYIPKGAAGVLALTGANPEKR